MGRIRNLTGEFDVSNSRVINSAFYFQDVNMGDWSARFSSSLFKYEAMKFVRPSKVLTSNRVEDLQIELDTLNTWLFNTEKDSDILNFYDLKKQQWKLLWKKRKDQGKLSNRERIQKFVQGLNDYGTNWEKPLNEFLN